MAKKKTKDAEWTNEEYIVHLANLSKSISNQLFCNTRIVVDQLVSCVSVGNAQDEQFLYEIFEAVEKIRQLHTSNEAVLRQILVSAEQVKEASSQEKSPILSTSTVRKITL